MCHRTDVKLTKMEKTLAGIGQCLVPANTACPFKGSSNLRRLSASIIKRHLCARTGSNRTVHPSLTSNKAPLLPLQGKISLRTDRRPVWQRGELSRVAIIPHWPLPLLIFSLATGRTRQMVLNSLAMRLGSRRLPPSLTKKSLT